MSGHVKRLLPSLIYISILYGSIPCARPIASVLRKHGVLRFTIFVLCALLFVVLYRILKRHLKFKSFTACVCSLFFFAIYVFLFSLIRLPEERMHLVEYSILPAVLAYSLKTLIPKKLRWPTIAVLCAALGAGDELIQNLLPERYFEWGDVYLNYAGSALGLGMYFLIHKIGNRHL